ncbi:hypothetical protein JGS22_022925 [Streptomyces sp. P38-E01]|uniref:Uncharacterized protein n=1 Tax=Streptomyces tardus TaxID=2780544 RepID=A0A949JKI9_9ACTN|nr:hypothetical protein [Streptomyces tardus]MBU7600405.1 hypothetical protein [Streptomyces tardus]
MTGNGANPGSGTHNDAASNGGTQHGGTPGDGPATGCRPDLSAWPPAEGAAAEHGPALLEWVTADEASGTRLCLIRGARGSGKSGLLAWFLAGSASSPRTAAHAMAPAAGLHADAVARELGRQLGYGPVSVERLLARIDLDERPLLLVVADLHRAGRGPADRPEALPETVWRRVLLPLLARPRVRLLAEVGGGEVPADLPVPVPTTSLPQVPPQRPAEEHHDQPGQQPYGQPESQPSAASSHSPGCTVIDLGDVGPSGPGELSTEAPTAGAQGVPRSADGRPRWDLASAAAREDALDDACASGDAAAVGALLSDPGFLLYGSAVAIDACLADERLPAPPGLRETWRLAAPQLTDTAYGAEERAALLHAAATAHAPSLARYLLPLARRHCWHARWCRTDTPVTALGGRANAPNASTAADATDARTATEATGATSTADAPEAEGTLLAVEPTGAVRQLDRATGEFAGALPLTHERAGVRGVAVRRDGAMLLLDGGGGLRALTGEDEGTSATVLDGITAHHGYAALRRPEAAVTALAQCPVSGSTVLGDRDGNVHVWQIDEYRPLPVTQSVHRAPVLAVAPLTLDGGVGLVFSAGMDGAVRMWAPGSPPMDEPVEQRPVFATALAASRTRYGPVLAVAWSDLSLSLWRIEDGALRRLPLLAEADAMALDGTGHLVLTSTAGLWGLRLDLDALWP